MLRVFNLRRMCCNLPKATRARLVESTRHRLMPLERSRQQSGSGRRGRDRLSNILKTFNDQFGHILWEDEDRVRRLITEEIPAKVAEDTAYRNARENSDRQNARIEHDEALKRVMTAVLNDDMQTLQAVHRQRGVPAMADG